MIDLRSDTVSRPSPAMRAAIAAAPVGDDVFGDDPTVARLEREVADLLAKPAAVFVTSGTQGNLSALLAHCQRGDEIIVGDNAHMFKYEAGGGAVLGSVATQTVRMLGDGSLDLDHVRAVVKPDDHHFARTRLVCVENTHDGKVQSVERMTRTADLAREYGLAVHLDGARLWNAAIDLGATPAEIAAPFDSVSVCLSKGLGAPVGSVLVGPTDFIHEARKWRKMLGGALRQVGIIAAAGSHAIANNRERLVEDHQNAADLATGLAKISGVDVWSANTNMVFASLPIDDDRAFVDALAKEDILVRVHDGETRLVTHLDVDAAAIARCLTVIGDLLAASR